MTSASVRTELVTTIGTAEAVRTVASLVEAAPPVEAAERLARRRGAREPRPPVMADARARSRVARAVSRAQLASLPRARHLPTVGTSPPIGTHARAVHARAARRHPRRQRGRRHGARRVRIGHPTPPSTAVTVERAPFHRAVETRPPVIAFARTVGGALAMARARVRAQPS